MTERSPSRLSRRLSRFASAALPESSSENLLRRGVFTGFVVAVTLTSLLVYCSWRNLQRSATDAAWDAHTHDVMEALAIARRPMPPKRRAEKVQP